MFSFSPPQRVSILSYHNISANNAVNKALQKDTVRAVDFERQMRFLRERGFQVLPLRDVVSLIQEKRKPANKTVVITFDDGYASTASLAHPVLRKHGFPCSVFLATDFIGTPAFPWLPRVADDPATPMCWEEVRELHKEGVDIGSHTASHRFLPGIAVHEMETDLMKSKEAIRERLGQAPDTFAVPFSFPLSHRQWPFFKLQLIEVLRKARFSSCCTLQRARITAGSELVFLPRIPVMRDDTSWSFYAKAMGFYAYTGFPQSVYQSLFKKYDYRAEGFKTKEVG